MRTKLDLFFKWGIDLNNAYEAGKNEVREVRYAGKDALIAEIEKREGYVAPPMTRRAAARGGGIHFAPAPIEARNNPARGGFRIGGQNHDKT